MKNLSVTIRAELEVPDHWELVEHPSGMQVIRIGDHFVDFDLAPLTTTSDSPDAEWSDVDQDLVEEVLDAIAGMDSSLELAPQQ
ncbi:MAG: hypothetical protein IPH08_11940 [Rhodocyclaceae bacterium]|jgi:hypothetical protein|nr:hypothetical protein [Rhodocyclaceae bacterium]MBK6907733.1 hypothetical protein [Rhodocyclaceae bacterium]